MARTLPRVRISHDVEETVGRTILLDSGGKDVAEGLASPQALARAYITHPSSENETVGGHVDGPILMGGLQTWLAVEVLHGVHNGDRIAARRQRQGD
jgi:hypothetical protein